MAGRPKKENGKVEKLKKEKEIKKKEKAENNATIVEANKQLEVIAQKFIDNPQPFFEERLGEIAKVIEKYGDLQNEDLKNGEIKKKDYSIHLSKHLIKPIIPNTGSVVQKHTPHSLKMVSDFYWNEIVLKVNEKTQFVPSIYHICKLLNISMDTLRKYGNDGIEQMRETCAMIKDEFIEYYQQKGLTKELNDVMAMFVLKTSFGQRENDQPQIAVINNVVSPQEKIDKYARQHGYEIWKED